MDRLLRAALLAHAETQGFKAKVAHGLEVIERSLPSNPYVAFSGGKDSLVAMALAVRVQPRIAALWSDDELEYPEQIVYIPMVCKEMGVKLQIKMGRTLHAGWFTPWVDSPFFREPTPGMLVAAESSKTLMPRKGHRAVILGLRREENSVRQIYLSRRHEVYEANDGMTRVHPIAGWTVYDIWAAIAVWNLPYNPAYDRMAAIGVPLDKQRIGPLPLSPEYHLKFGWPETYSRLVKRYGNRWR